MTAAKGSELDEDLKNKALGVIAFGYRLLKIAGYEVDESDFTKEQLQKEIGKYSEYCDSLAEFLSCEEYEVHRHGLKQGIELLVERKIKAALDEAAKGKDAEINQLKADLATVVASKLVVPSHPSETFDKVLDVARKNTALEAKLAALKSSREKAAEIVKKIRNFGYYGGIKCSGENGQPENPDNGFKCFFSKTEVGKAWGGYCPGHTNIFNELDAALKDGEGK